MKLSAKVVNEVLSYSSDISLKNHCKMIIDSYIFQEPDLIEEDLKKSLVIYLQGLE